MDDSICEGASHGAAAEGSAAPSLFYRVHGFICTNHRTNEDPRGSCAARGGEAMRTYMKARAKELGLKDIRINGAACLERCGHGPTMVVYPDGVWYSVRSSDDADEILRKHFAQGQRVDRLALPPKD